MHTHINNNDNNNNIILFLEKIAKGKQRASPHPWFSVILSPNKFLNHWRTKELC